MREQSGWIPRAKSIEALRAEVGEDDGPGAIKTEFGDFLSVEEARVRYDVDRIIKRFGTWAVTDYGVECLTTNYAIPKDRLGESDWKKHMCGKTWIVAEDVCDSLDYAKAHFARRVGRPPGASSAVRAAASTTARAIRRNIPSRVRFYVMKRDNYRCQLCGATALQGTLLEIDHKVAVAAGGTNDEGNLWVLCNPCNSGKGVSDL